MLRKLISLIILQYFSEKVLFDGETKNLSNFKIYKFHDKLKNLSKQSNPKSAGTLFGE